MPEGPVTVDVRISDVIAKLKKEATEHNAQAKKLNQRIALLEQVAANPEAHKDLLDVLK